MDKQQLKEREARVIELATAFCKEHLDDECAELCTKLVQKLGRKRSYPLQSGRVEIWALQRAAESYGGITDQPFMSPK